MPLSKYFKGHGEKVMQSMKETYKDPEKAREVFYATANAQKDKLRRPFGEKKAEDKNA